MTSKTIMAVLLLLSICSCTDKSSIQHKAAITDISENHVLVLGVAQDAGYPQAGCQKACCQKSHAGTITPKHVSCISLIDPTNKTYWIFDATPDFKEQLQVLQQSYPDFVLAGIFLTHAHVGHYTGLMHLGREIMGAAGVPVYAMPQMKLFLETNGPWSQLVTLNNIAITEIISDEQIKLNNQLSVIPIQVPHRDEFSETVGYKIIGSNNSLMFIPDIDKWGKWDRDIIKEIKSVDHALLDGTFYQNGEIPGRDMSLIPHPFIMESMALFEPLEITEKKKINFIHFNHTNPVIDSSSVAYKQIYSTGMAIASEGMKFEL